MALFPHELTRRNTKHLKNDNPDLNLTDLVLKNSFTA